MAAILALAAGAVLRRSAGAITAVVVRADRPADPRHVLPQGPAQWLLRLTPAAAFSVQQGTPHYSQVTTCACRTTAAIPLSPWHGFAVLCVWAALALAGAIYLLRRRDA